MNKLVLLFSIIFISSNINDLNAHYEMSEYMTYDNNDSDYEDINEIENFNYEAHLQNIRNIHDIVWDTNNFTEHLPVILSEFHDNPYGDNSSFYAREIITRMIKDDDFKTNIMLILNQQQYSQIKNILVDNFKWFIWAYNDMYLQYNKDDEGRKILLVQLIDFGYDENNDNDTNFKAYVSKCLKLYDEINNIE